MNASSTGLNALNGLGGLGAAAVASAGDAGSDVQAIVIILPGKRDAAAQGDSTDISDCCCECDHHSPALAPAPKTPAPGFIPSSGAVDAGRPAGGGNSGGVLQALVAVLAMLMLLLKKLLGLDNSGSGHHDHDYDHSHAHSCAAASAGQKGNGPSTMIVIDY